VVQCSGRSEAGGLLPYFLNLNAMSPLTQEHFDETMRSIAETLTEHNGRFDSINTRLDKIDGRLDELANFETLRENVRHLENRIRILETTRGT
jgi:hypothetical protein